MSIGPSDVWQPSLYGELVRIRPMVMEDFDALYAVGSDPVIWSQHPEKDRYKHDNFSRFFQSGIESKGAFVVLNSTTGRIIGSTRFTGHDIGSSIVEIGYTFLAPDYWGKGHNSDLKKLMLTHAFKVVEKVHFYIGEANHRSRRAVEKLGATLLRSEARTPMQGGTYTAVVYEITEEAWRQRTDQFIFPPAGSFVQPELSTMRLALVPITESHAEELYSLFEDPELHIFVPSEPMSIEKQRERCAIWARRRSSDGRELWLNWAARDKESKRVVGHFQSGVKDDGIASVGYTVARGYQRQGFALEALNVIFAYLRDNLHVREIKAWSDTRNKASHGLATKLGMKQVEFLKDADFFKGSSSDEFVFSLKFS